MLFRSVHTHATSLHLYRQRLLQLPQLLTTTTSQTTCLIAMSTRVSITCKCVREWCLSVTRICIWSLSVCACLVATHTQTSRLAHFASYPRVKLTRSPPAHGDAPALFPEMCPAADPRPGHIAAPPDAESRGPKNQNLARCEQQHPNNGRSLKLAPIVTPNQLHQSLQA